MGDVFTEEGDFAALQSAAAGEDGITVMPASTSALSTAAGDYEQQQPFVLRLNDPLPAGLLQLARLVALHEEGGSKDIARLIEDSVSAPLATTAASNTGAGKGKAKPAAKAKGKGKAKANVANNSPHSSSSSSSSSSAGDVSAVKIGRVLSLLSAPLSNELTEAIAHDIVDGMLGNAFQSTASALDVAGWSSLHGIELPAPAADDGGGGGNDDDDNDEYMDGPPPEAAAFEELAALTRASDCIAVGSSSYCVTACGCQVATTESKLAVLMVAMDALRGLMGEDDDFGEFSDGDGGGAAGGGGGGGGGSAF